MKGEELARLIDPRAWEPDHKGAIAAAMQTRRDDTLAKAAAILTAGWTLVPEGSVVVPRMPTEAMMYAAALAWAATDAETLKAWRAMCIAAEGG